MTRVVRETTARAPPERVFAALVEPAQRARWITSMREAAAGGRLVMGARVEGRRSAAASRSTYMLTVRRLDEGRVLEMDIARNGDHVARAGYELAPVPEGTRVKAWAEAQLKGLQKLAAPMVTSGMEQEMAADLAALVRFVEAG